MIRVGDWCVIIGLSEYKDFQEGKILRIYGELAELLNEKTGVKRNVNVKYLRKIKKEVSKEEKVNAALDLGMKDWFMALTGDSDD